MNGTTEPITWPRLRDGWIYLPRASRLNYLGAAAACLHDLWRHHADLSEIRLDEFSFRTDVGPVTAQLPSVHMRRLEHPLSQAKLLGTLADWHYRHGEIFSARDRLGFLHALLAFDSVDQATFAYTARRVARLATQRCLARARQLYREHVRQAWTARWRPTPSLPQDQFQHAITEAGQNAQTVLIKNTPQIRVMRANLLGHDVLIKRFDLNGWLDRVKYRWRASRARRAWAAAITMRELGVPTPEPLGFLEIHEGGVAVTSYFVTSFLPDAASTYRWLKVNYRRQGEDWKRAFRSDLLKALVGLYRAGIYHADTKLSNLLVRFPGDRERREFCWIDLECVSAGVKPTRLQIIRNVVQLNGSLRYWVPETDRMKFLHALSQTYTWVTRPDVVQKIRRWTRKRLLRELRRHTTPDGLLGRRR